MSDLERRTLELQAFRDDMKKRGKPSTLIKDFHERFRREEEVRQLKERYSKKYLLIHKLVTREEYKTIRGESDYRRQKRKAAEVAEIMHRVVGCGGY